MRTMPPGMARVKDLTGQRFHHLVVIRRGENNAKHQAQWWCQCDCGHPPVLVHGPNLRFGLTKSCGHLIGEAITRAGRAYRASLPKQEGTAHQRYKERWPDRIKAAQDRYRATAKYRRNSADKARRRAYGITPEQYDFLILRAAGFCELCGAQGAKTDDRELVVDHDHTSGLVRGLICQACNKVLGFMERHGFERKWMDLAEQYLNRTPWIP